MAIPLLYYGCDVQHLKRKHTGAPPECGPPEKTETLWALYKLSVLMFMKQITNALLLEGRAFVIVATTRAHY